MSPELAALLDGPVSERFGRPIDRCGIPYRLSGDEWSAYDNHGVDDPISESLWLAHLLDQCGEQRWCVHLWDAIEGKALAEACISDWTNSHFDYQSKGTTLLEAIARAMLAVPTEDRP